LIENIFLLGPNGNGWSAHNNEDQKPLLLHVFVAYPDEAEIFNTPPLMEKIFFLYRSTLEKAVPIVNFTDDYLLENTKALAIESLHFLTTPLPDKFILGLVMDDKTNPYNYRNELVRLLLEYFLKYFVESKKDKNITTLLLTLFVDIRKYDDELAASQEVQNRVMIIGNVPMVKAFVYGIDNAGKSSLMRLLATGKFDPDYFPPTKKFRITNIKLRSGAKLVAWDMPGQRIFRVDWLRGAQASNILIFMLDLADVKRFDEAKQALWNMIDLFELQNLPLLFLANKTDLLPQIPSKEELITKFDLYKLNKREWYLLFTSVAQNQGIKEIIDWIEGRVDQLLLIHGIAPINNSK
jgi:small GTP-binding protein